MGVLMREASFSCFCFIPSTAVRSELFGNENLEAKKGAVKVKNRTFSRHPSEPNG
jgi:hypothetical protein